MNEYRRSIAIVMLVFAPKLVHAQDPAYLPPQPSYPQFQQPAYQPPGARQGRMRQFFAATLAAVVQGSGVPATAGLTDLVAGGITDWFDRKRRRKAAASGESDYPQAAGAQVPYAPAAPYDPQAAATTYQSAPAYEPSAQYTGADAGAGATAAYAPAQYAPVQYFDTQSGAASSVAPAYLSANSGTQSAFASAVPVATTLYAGLAYEVHTLASDGSTMPVNPANHEFHTGDQFVVLYRPSLPGRMRVVNVNPVGRETEIDTVDVAAGQLLRLGPYRFEAMSGEEALRFTITPCSSPALAFATRDIVKVDAQPVSTAFNFGACNSLDTRGARRPVTRDIRKVAVEGSTGFAFDPVSPEELRSGELAARELTVMFHHR